ncbi:WD repeat domain 27 [Turdus rufiventris]|nr:WD repeat domain 27 [Turdus rufiventris]
MESAGACCASGGSRGAAVVCEKLLFKGKLPEPLFQLACGHQRCAYPVHRNVLCVWNTATAQVWDYSTSQLIYRSGIIAGLHIIGTLVQGEGQNNSKLCKTDNMKPEGSVETSLPILLIEHCDFFVCFHDEKNTYSSQNTSYFWIGTSTGLLIINLANFELEATLSYRDYSDLSIRIARSCALMRKAANGKVLCLITSMFEDMIAVLEVNVAALVRTQHCDFLPRGNEKSLSVIARCTLLANSPLCKGLERKMKEPSSNTLGGKKTVKDKPLVFHNKIKSSGYTAAPRMTMFSPNANLKKQKASKWKASCECQIKEYPLESCPPIKYAKDVTITCKPTPIFCVEYSGDGELLACGQADSTVLIFNSNLTDVHHVLSGHDGAVNSIGWSHDRKWLVSASEDRTLRVWSACNEKPVLILVQTEEYLQIGREISHDFDNGDYRPFSNKFNFNTENSTDIVLTAGSNRALEVFDLNAGCSTAVIQEAHVRSVHQICQNKGSSFSTQQLEAYNLFLTTASGDGIKLWDLRTLRCERRFEGHSSRCYPCGIAVSPCGRFIASGSDDKYRIFTKTCVGPDSLIKQITNIL